MTTVHLTQRRSTPTGPGRPIIYRVPVRRAPPEDWLRRCRQAGGLEVAIATWLKLYRLRTGIMSVHMLPKDFAAWWLSASDQVEGLRHLTTAKLVSARRAPRQPGWIVTPHIVPKPGA